MTILRCIILLCCLLTTNVFAQTDLSATANQVFSQLTLGLKTLKASNQLDQQHVQQLLEQQLIPQTETKFFSYKVLGQQLTKLSAQQKDAFVQALTFSLVKSYASILKSYNDEDIALGNIALMPSGKIATIPFAITRVNGSQVKAVSKWLYNNKVDEWRVFDIVIEGISLIDSKKAEINNNIRQFGIDDTIAKLNRK